jgi:hypothetical protein
MSWYDQTEFQNWVIRKLNRLEQLLLAIQRTEGYELMWLDDLKGEVANNTTVSQGAVVAINSLADKLQSVINAGADPAELQALVDTLRANDTSVAAAITARTPVETEPTPTPVEPNVVAPAP